MDDLIQRQAVLDALRARFGVDFDWGKWWSSTHVLAAVESVPGVTQEPKYCDRNICVKNEYNGIGCDECEVTKSQEPCEDMISRKSIKQKLQEQHDFFVNAYGGFSNLSPNDKSRVDEITNCIAMVVNEPPVTPQYTEAEIQKMQELEQAEIEKAYELGKAERQKAGRWERDQFTNQPTCSKCGYKGWQTRYCPNCGAKMEEVKA